MLFRLTMLFQLTTNPVNVNYATARSGGWSESLIYSLGSPLIQTSLNFLFTKRANILPTGASLVGYRQAQITLEGNKILAGATQTSKVTYPGGSGLKNDAGQISLEIYGRSASSTNSNRFRLGGLPDDVVTNGEFNPNPAFAVGLTLYLATIKNGTFAPSNLPPMGFIGRDLNQFETGVVSIAGGVVSTAAPIPGIAIGDYLRFHRCRDDFGRPIKGTFRVTAVAPSAYTLQNFPAQTVSNPNGQVRLDQLAAFNWSSLYYGAVVSHKIGRPFVGYRGRASKKKVV